MTTLSLYSACKSIGVNVCQQGEISLPFNFEQKSPIKLIQRSRYARFQNNQSGLHLGEDC